MSNHRQDREVPEGFSRYEGKCEKVFHTIILFSGKTVGHCWPAAGIFIAIPGTESFDGSKVFAIKPEAAS